jgi:hypothetical protein
MRIQANPLYTNTTFPATWQTTSSSEGTDAIGVAIAFSVGETQKR